MQVTAAVLVNAKLLAGSPLPRLGSAEPPGQQFFMGEFHLLGTPSWFRGGAPQVDLATFTPPAVVPQPRAADCSAAAVPR